MSRPSMLKEHQPAAPWEWLLAPSQATVLAAATLPRWLAVSEGRVWLTVLKPKQPERAAEDIWLQAGQRHALPPGTAWLLEGWPQARVNVLLEAPAPRRAGLRRGCGAGRARGRPFWPALRAQWRAWQRAWRPPLRPGQRAC